MADEAVTGAPALVWEPVYHDATKSPLPVGVGGFVTMRAPVESGWIYSTTVQHVQGAPETVQVFVPAKG